jgi:hypothetical protein
MRSCRRLLLQIFLAFALAACGGAGDQAEDTATPTSAAVQVPPEQPRSSGQQSPPAPPEQPPPEQPPPEQPPPEQPPPVAAPTRLGTPDTIEPDAAAIAEAQQAAEPVPAFETAQTIDALSYGLIGDGHTDNTQTFRTLLAGGDRTIHVPAGDYVTGRLEFSPRTILVLAPGVTIRDSGLLATYDRLLNIQTHDVQIVGLGASVVSNRSRYTSGEWRHGVYIYGASNVVIDGLQSSSHGGDGFYIGGPAGRPSTDVQLRGCRADHNRRQGLSITSARRVQIIDSEFMNTRGTAPEFGIDLEPNASYDALDRIVILRAQTEANAGGGIMIHLARLTAASPPVNLTIIDHGSKDEPLDLVTHVPAGVAAVLRYGSSTIRP